MKRTIVSKKKELVASKLYKFILERESLERILQYIYTYPERELSLSDLSREIGNVSKSTVHRVLGSLENEGIIKKKQLNTIFRIKANVGEWSYLKRKITYNIASIFDSGLVETVLESLEKKGIHPKAVIVFGSFRTGEDISTSDVDIAVEVSDGDLQSVPLVDEEGNHLTLLERKIQLHIFNRKKIDAELFNNLANGIVLYGFLEVKP